MCGMRSSSHFTGPQTSLTCKKSHLGGLPDWRSHESVVSTACSNSLVSLNSRRTNREEEAKKPHITTITAASGTEGKKGYCNHSQRRSKGVTKKGKHVAYTLIQKRVVCHMKPALFVVLCKLAFSPKPFEALLKFESLVGISFLSACLFYSPLLWLHVFLWHRVLERMEIRQWDLSVITDDCKKYLKMYINCIPFIHKPFLTSRLLKVFAEIRSICVP